MRGKKGANWRGGKVVKVCEQCGKDFWIRPSRRTRARFCSYKCAGLWRSENMRGKNNPLWKERIKRDCEQCGKEFYIRPYEIGRFCSKECHIAWQSENMQMENSPAWKGGLSFESYGIEFDEKLKKMIRERDGHTCAICGNFGKHVHHISYVKTDNNPENLITLCKKCHGKTNGNRRFWTTVLTPIAQNAAAAIVSR